MITHLHLPNVAEMMQADDGPMPDVVKEAFHQLQLYLTGKLKKFDLPLQPAGTPFMRHVWTKLRRVPYGTTVSYQQLAIVSGHPKAMRAVGLANKRNPIAIFIPCHRVIGASGKLVGFGGGLPLKQWLLEHERQHG
jgi:methylated-DNA-[protein]-cysteine S-methyltransferase